MTRTRLAALAVLGVLVAAGCSEKLNNGEECLKNTDCISDRCVQYLCVDPTSSRVPAVTDSGAEAEVAVDSTPAETSAPPMDTGSVADTKEAGSETSSDAGAD